MARQKSTSLQSAQKLFTGGKKLLFAGFAKTRGFVVAKAKKGVRFSEKRPFTSFFILLALLFILILAGNALAKKETVTKTVSMPKVVDVYRVGATPQMEVQAKIEKTGVVKIVAQTGGIVANIAVTEGQTVAKGKTLLSLSSNYQGGNAASLQRSIAQVAYQNTKDTYDLQKDTIAKERDIANKSNDNASDLRDITKHSVNDTNSLLDLNDQVLFTLDTNINAYTATNSAGINDALILSSKEMKTQFQSASTQLRTALRNNEYQANGDNPPGQLATLQRDVALKQLDLQEKALQLSFVMSKLQLQLALVNEAMMYPAAPFFGVVERVYVTPGQMVTPGAPLATIRGDETVKAVISLPQSVAQRVSQTEPTIFQFGNQTFATLPFYVSTDVTDGTLYTLLYTIPDSYQDAVASDAYITALVPVGYPTTSSVIPFIPIDSVYQSQDASYVYVVSGGIAKSKTVALGDVYGRFVSVRSGLSDKDLVILDRTVVAGEAVVAK